MAGEDIITQIFDYGKFILVWFWWAILLLWLIVMKMRWKNFPVEAIIFEKRGENLVKTNDRAGKYTDVYTGITGYRLLKAKDTIPVLSYDWVMHNALVHTTLLERIVNFLRGNAGTIFLFKYGTKQYKPIKINQDGKEKTIYKEIVDDKGSSVFINVYVPFDPRKKIGTIDFEVVDWDNMNFMVQEQRASIVRRQRKSEFWKQIAIPLAVIGATVIFSIIMIKFGYDFATGMSKSTSQPQESTKPNIPIISDMLP